MRPCDAPDQAAMRDALVDLLYGMAEPDAERATRAHLASCPACAAAFEEMRALTSSLRPEEAFEQEAEVDWGAFARATVRRATLEDAAAQPARIHPFEWIRGAFTMPRRPVWAAAAASLVIVVGLSMVSMKSGLFQIPGAGPAGPGAQPAPVAGVDDAAAEVMMPEANIDNLTVSLARQNTAEYLRQTKAVLVTLLDVNIDCDNDKVDVSAERAKAAELLRRQRLIAAELHRMPLARAQDVCNDLEKLLLEVASLTDCTRNDEIQTLRDQIERRQIFVRMELLGQDLARAEGPRA